MPPNLALIVSSKKPSAPGYRGGKVEGLRSHRQLQDLSWEEVRPVERFLAWCWAKCKCVLSTKGCASCCGGLTGQMYWSRPRTLRLWRAQKTPRKPFSSSLRVMQVWLPVTYIVFSRSTPCLALLAATAIAHSVAPELWVHLLAMFGHWQGRKIDHWLFHHGTGSGRSYEPYK